MPASNTLRDTLDRVIRPRGGTTDIISLIRLVNVERSNLEHEEVLAIIADLSSCSHLANDLAMAVDALKYALERRNMPVEQIKSVLSQIGNRSAAPSNKSLSEELGFGHMNLSDANVINGPSLTAMHSAVAMDAVFGKSSSHAGTNAAPALPAPLPATMVKALAAPLIKSSSPVDDSVPATLTALPQSHAHNAPIVQSAAALQPVHPAVLDALSSVISQQYASRRVQPPQLAQAHRIVGELQRLVRQVLVGTESDEVALPCPPPPPPPPPGRGPPVGAAPIARAPDVFSPSPSLTIFGSIVNGFGTSNSDVDCACVIGREVEARVLRGGNLIDGFHDLRRRLPRAGFPIFQYIQPGRAAVPLLRMTHGRSGGTKVDLGFGNTLGPHNTRLLATYAALDERVAPLGVGLKLWAGARGVNDASAHFLSSYSWILLAIWALQQPCTGPVLPCLQDPDMVREYEAATGRTVPLVTIDGHDVRFVDDVTWLRGHTARLQQRVAAGAVHAGLSATASPLAPADLPIEGVNVDLSRYLPAAAAGPHNGIGALFVAMVRFLWEFPEALREGTFSVRTGKLVPRSVWADRLKPFVRPPRRKRGITARSGAATPASANGGPTPSTSVDVSSPPPTPAAPTPSIDEGAPRDGDGDDASGDDDEECSGDEGDGGGNASAAGGKAKLPPPWRISVEDPFDLTHDLGRPLRPFGRFAIAMELQRACKTVDKLSGDFEAIVRRHVDARASAQLPPGATREAFVAQAPAAAVREVATYLGNLWTELREQDMGIVEGMFSKGGFEEWAREHGCAEPEGDGKPESDGKDGDGRGPAHRLGGAKGAAAQAGGPPKQKNGSARGRGGAAAAGAGAGGPGRGPGAPRGRGGGNVAQAAAAH